MQPPARLPLLGLPRRASPPLGTSMNIRLQHLVLLAAAGVALSITPRAHAADEAAAMRLARQSNCLKCHAVDKKKEAPAYKDIAAKYKGKPDAHERIVHHITSGERVKFDDGHEEDHAIVKTKDKAQIDNLVDWILSQ
jgi:cytochrome c